MMTMQIMKKSIEAFRCTFLNLLDNRYISTPKSNMRFYENHRFE